MIDATQPLTQIHSELCVNFRQLSKIKDQQSGICVHCDRPQSEHIRDGRCTVNTLSPRFQWKLAEDFQKTTAALELIEQLLKL